MKAGPGSIVLAPAFPTNEDRLRWISFLLKLILTVLEDIRTQFTLAAYLLSNVLMQGYTRIHAYNL